MDLSKQNQIREALRQMAAAHAATTQQMELAMCLLEEALQLEEQSKPRENFAADSLQVDRSLLAVKYRGRHCFLGNTLLFRLIERLAAQPNKYLAYEDLLSEVWESTRSDGAVRSVVRRLREVDPESWTGGGAAIKRVGIAETVGCLGVSGCFPS